MKTISGKTITIDTAPSATILQIKQAIWEKDAIPITSQRLRFNGVYLEDDTVIATSGISNSDCLHVSLALRGGSAASNPAAGAAGRPHTSSPRPESQRRAAKWRERIETRTPTRDALYEYELGRATIDRPDFPSVSELKEKTNKHMNSKEVKKKGLITDHFGLAKGIAAARLEQRHVIEAMEKQVKEGSFGFVPTEKDDNVGRFVFENYNSLSPWATDKRFMNSTDSSSFTTPTAP